MCRHGQCTAILASLEGLRIGLSEIHSLSLGFKRALPHFEGHYTIALFSLHQKIISYTTVKHAMARQKAKNAPISDTRTHFSTFTCTPICQRQSSHAFTPRAYGDFPVRTRTDAKGASLECAEESIDNFLTKTLPWTDITDEEIGSCLKQERIGVSNDNACSDMSRSPSPNYCYNTGKERGSTPPDLLQSYQIYNDIDTGKSF